MNLKEYIKINGIQSEVPTFNTWSSVDVGFINSDGMEDETQFDIMFACTKAGNRELEVLYKDFCKENYFPTNTVQNVTIVKCAHTFAELNDLI